MAFGSNSMEHPKLHCTIVRQLSEQQVPVTSPGNLQCPLEFWIPSEKAPLLGGPLPSKEAEVAYSVVCEDSTGGGRSTEKRGEVEDESTCSIACQVFLPFMIAGFGTVAAGLMLDAVQNWTVFQEVPEMFVLVPALLGLKGNLEMTLASRISTLANIGTIDSVKEQWKMALGNLSLLQCQSLVLGMIASLFAAVVGCIREKEFNVHNVFLLCSSSLATASVASFLLGSITIFVVVFSKRLNINPDNVAAPVSASLGDVVTLALLAMFSRLLFAHSGHIVWLEALLVVCFLCLIPLWAVLSYRNEYTRHVLYSGWIPIISAVVISSGGGYILNFAVARFKEIAAYQPVINGVGGNLVAVQACRISTYLHQKVTPDGLSKEDLCVSPFVAWFGKSVHSRTCRILLLISIPGHLIFIICVHTLKSSYTPLTAEFLLLYLMAALLQVALLLYLAHCFVHWLWKWGFDPDDAAIPYLTALGDLMGTSFLLVAFIIMDTI